MIGYEKYNNLSKQWEYYTTGTTAQSQQPTQYRDPQQLSISGLGNAMTAKQNRYDNNVQQVQRTVNLISNQINNLDVTDKQRQLIHDTFQKSCINEVNRTKINYSSANETNRIIQWLYDSINTIIKNVTAPSFNSMPDSNSQSSNYSSNSLVIANYGKKLPVYNIAVFSQSSNRLRDETIMSDSYVIINENRIEFKRADGFVTYRNFYDKVYNEQKKGYTYSSTTGAVFIHDDLKYVEFFETNLAEGENYTYFITPFGNR
ncbi:hypothetical protein EG348_21335 [Chryseobacterium sp. G0201]|nr:hypothetical protein EG348_21335 [Chryseobacterium sp. G0201]